MERQRKPWTTRRLHLWVAVALAVPLILTAVSGALIAMRSMSTTKVPMHWLGAESVPSRLPMNAFAQTVDGASWIGNAQGLFVVRNGVVQQVDVFSGLEVIALAPLGQHPKPLVATRMAVWVENDGQWKAVRRGRVRQLTALTDGTVLAIAGGRGELADSQPQVTLDGRHWEAFGPALRAQVALPELTEPTVPLSQLMREVHSGAFFWGKGPGEIAWGNLMGWSLVVLCLTGLWMWLRREREQSRTRRMDAAVDNKYSDGKAVQAREAS